MSASKEPSTDPAVIFPAVEDVSSTRDATATATTEEANADFWFWWWVSGGVWGAILLIWMVFSG